VAIPLLLRLGVELADVDNLSVAREDRLHHLIVVGAVDGMSADVDHKVDGSLQLLEEGPVVPLALDATGSKLILAGCVQGKPDDRAFFEELKRSVDLVVDVGRYPVNGDYYDEVMKPILSCDRQIVYVGELDTEAKKQWYRHARATLFPIRWGEPFGMVLIESLACGTPILAFGRGAVPEIVTHGETGFVVSSLAGMVAAVGLVDQIDRRRCRADVAARFSVDRMAKGYADLYRSVARARAYGGARSVLPSSVEWCRSVSAR